MTVLTKTQIRNIVAFCTIMNDGETIMDKSPEYIEEKFLRYCQSETEEWPWGMHPNLKAAVFDKWREKWDKVEELEEDAE